MNLPTTTKLLTDQYSAALSTWAQSGLAHLPDELANKLRKPPAVRELVACLFEANLRISDVANKAAEGMVHEQQGKVAAEREIQELRQALAICFMIAQSRSWRNSLFMFGRQHPAADQVLGRRWKDECFKGAVRVACGLLVYLGAVGFIWRYWS